MLRVLLVLLLVLCVCAAPAAVWADEEAAADESAQSAEGSGSDSGESSGSGDDTGNRVYVNQLSDSSFLYQTAISDLAHADSYYEGQTVLIQGEVVGDCIADELYGNYCWITLQDQEQADPTTVSVHMTRDQAAAIDTYGEYGKVGTTLQVRGTFHLECADHQGLTDVHAEDASAIAAGYDNPAQVDKNLLIIAIVAAIGGAALLGVYHFKKEGTL